MVAMPSSMIVSNRGMALLNIAQKGSAFATKVANREVEAAKAATDMSRLVFTSRLSGRPLASPRTGRPTTGGQFADFINWLPDHKAGSIVFDLVNLEKVAPYFLIQEIGTNKSATILNPPGQVSVRSQVGRTISFNLFWAAGPGAGPSKATTGASGDQLYLAAELNAKNFSGRRKRIRREIKGKHYLQAGGQEGFIVLAEGLLNDAERIFR